VQVSTVRANASAPSYSFGWFDWFCLWYPPAWLILFNRHWQHYKSDPTGWNGIEYTLFLLPGGFYIALLLRWFRLWFRQQVLHRSLPESQDVEPDPAYQQAFRQEIIAPIVHYYFRGELHQVDDLPLAGPVILAMNHAGMCFPWDFVSLAFLLGEQRDWFVQPLAHPLFFDHPWLKWWLPKGWAQVLGGVRAERESFETALSCPKANGQEQNFAVLYAPEGWRGLAKGWQQRYKLAGFDSSFVRLSVRYQVPIVPVVCVGSEWLHPFTSNVNWLARRFKMPMFPLSPLIPIFVLFPSMGVWATRTRLQYYLQSSWQPWERLEPEQVRQSILHRLARELRSRMQGALNQQVGRGSGEE
jgi:1-acyl-sn-glycerol-3-phosphate acyltransferase